MDTYKEVPMEMYLGKYTQRFTFWMLKQNMCMHIQIRPYLQPSCFPTIHPGRATYTALTFIPQVKWFVCVSKQLVFETNLPCNSIHLSEKGHCSNQVQGVALS